MLMWRPFNAPLQQLLLEHAAGLYGEFLRVPDTEEVVYEHVEVDSFSRRPLPQLIGNRLGQATEEAGGLDIPEGQPSRPHESPGARMAHHHVMTGIGMNRHVKEAVPYVVLGEMRGGLQNGAHVPRRR